MKKATSRMTTDTLNTALMSNGRKWKAVFTVFFWGVLIGFAILFTTMSVVKLLDHARFEFQLGLAPGMHKLAPLVSWGIPFGQLLIIAAYFIDRFRLQALWATASLMLVFFLYNGFMLVFIPAAKLPCTCAGFEGVSWNGQLLINLGLLSFAVLGALAARAARVVNQEGQLPSSMEFSTKLSII